MKMGEDHDLAFEISLAIKHALKKYPPETHHTEVLAALMDVAAQTALVPCLTYQELEEAMRYTYEGRFQIDQARLRR